MRAVIFGTCVGLALLAVAGCNQNQGRVGGPFAQQNPGFFGGRPTPQNQTQFQQQLQQQQALAAQQQQELQSRATNLDRINEEKERQLAAARQDVKRLEAHVDAISQRLKETAGELDRARREKETVQQQVAEAQTGSRQRGGAVITANNSLGGSLEKIDIAGVDVRRDGEVIRVTLPAAKLFTPGGDRLTPEARDLLTRVAQQLVRNYPQQIIGIEGHTGSDPPSGLVKTNHELSTAWAMAVFEWFSSQGTFGPHQLHVAGHGGNHAIYSNATASGREANRRVEIVVYPEKPRTALR